MGALAVVKKAMGLDAVTALQNEIAAQEAALAQAQAAIDSLEAKKLAVTDFADFKKLDEDAAELRWRLRRAEERLAEFRPKLAAALLDARRGALARHYARMQKLFPKFTAALMAAVDMQVEVIKAREAAVRECGEQAVVLVIPQLAYAGFLYPDLVGIWKSEMTRVFSAPTPVAAIDRATAPPPAVTGRRRYAHDPSEVVATAELLHEKAVSDAGRREKRRRQEAEAPKPSPAVHRARQAPIEDRVKLGPGEVRCRVERIAGYTDMDGLQRVLGDIIRLPAHIGQVAQATGAVSIIEEFKS